MLTDGTAVPCSTVVWTGGVRGNPLAATVGLPVDQKDRLQVDGYLRVVGHPDIYAIGDGARCEALERRPELVNSAQAAADQGQSAARSILAEIRRSRDDGYRPRQRGVVVLVGNRVAVAHVGPFAPLRSAALWLKQAPMIEHLWHLGGPRLVARHRGSTILPLVAPSRVNRYALAGDAPPTANCVHRVTS